VVDKASVYQAICGVQSDLAKQGIAKDQENTFDHYKFRGIDDVYNALAPLLAKHQLCILPRMLSRMCEERQSQRGGALFYVTVDAEFDFVSAQDTSIHTVRVFGEAMDRGDKATSKAMSAAYKYACFQTFCIPTEGDNDADATTPDPIAKISEKPTAPEPAKPKTPKRQLYDKMVADGLSKWEAEEFFIWMNIPDGTADGIVRAVKNYDNLKADWLKARDK